MRLMKEMQLGPVKFKDFRVTKAQDNLIVSFWIAALEYRDGKELSPEYSPRLSVWKKDRRAVVMYCLCRSDCWLITELQI
ncbi:hypothetical protein [Polynucleobacter necessarius]|uniref:hypothetical protein n=1 Tax=Polynucleobacter necessarius TaxID=576610 RepID=UPI001E31C867|nr:hypothetical protein [Polynucleobacter necessarius]